MDSIMDRETRHRKMMAAANQHRELDKAKPQAMEYPHVYGAPTGGNILNAFGKKYALPQGTVRNHEDVISRKDLTYLSTMKRSLYHLFGMRPTTKNLLLSPLKILIVSVAEHSKDTQVSIEFNRWSTRWLTKRTKTC